MSRKKSRVPTSRIGRLARLGVAAGELAVGADAMRLQADKAVDARLRESLSRSDEGLTAVRHPAGHVGVNLEGRFMSMSLARVDADGTRVSFPDRRVDLQLSRLVEHVLDLLTFYATCGEYDTLDAALAESADFAVAFGRLWYSKTLWNSIRYAT